MKKILRATAVVVTLLMSGFVYPAQAQTVPVTGQVTKIDTKAEKITIKHDPIPNLDMGRMTMVFRVKDPGMLKTVKVGDTVSFEADRVNGALTVVSIAPK